MRIALIVVAFVVAAGCGGPNFRRGSFEDSKDGGNPERMMPTRFAVLVNGQTKHGFCKAPCNPKHDGVWQIDSLDEKTVIVPAIYDYAELFVDERAVVAQRDKDGRLRYGFVDPKGAVAIPMMFTWATTFRSGRALVQFDDGAIALIDATGKPVKLVNGEGPLAGLVQLQTIPRQWLEVAPIAGRDAGGWGFLAIDGEEVRFVTDERFEDIASVDSRTFGRKSDTEVYIQDHRVGHPWPLRGRRGASWYLIDPFTLQLLRALGNERGFAWVSNCQLDGTGVAQFMLVRYSDGEEKALAWNKEVCGGHYMSIYEKSRPPHDSLCLVPMDTETAFKTIGERGEHAAAANAVYRSIQRDDADSASIAWILAAQTGNAEKAAKAERMYQARRAEAEKQQILLELKYAKEAPRPPPSSIGSGRTYSPAQVSPSFDQAAADRSYNSYKSWLNNGNWDRSSRPN